MTARRYSWLAAMPVLLAGASCATPAEPDYAAALMGAADWGFDDGAGCAGRAHVLRINADDDLIVLKAGEEVSYGAVLKRERRMAARSRGANTVQGAFILTYRLDRGEDAQAFTIFRDSFQIGGDADSLSLQLERRDYRYNPERAWRVIMPEYAPLSAAEDPRWHGERLRLC